jgi:hypothetical protein
VGRGIHNRIATGVEVAVDLAEALSVNSFEIQPDSLTRASAAARRIFDRYVARVALDFSLLRAASPCASPSKNKTHSRVVSMFPNSQGAGFGFGHGRNDDLSLTPVKEFRHV